MRLVSMTEKTEREILVRTQDGMLYCKFELPLYVNGSDKTYYVYMGGGWIGKYTERKHAVHVMNYLLAQRNHYMFDDVPNVKSIILNVPTDELVRQTPDENLLDGIPVKGDDDEPQG